ncbi:MAG: polysaccharide biosynthesis tyrosine autokinase [Mailhella sp.]|nr:polysaccharide biosynthesis tyrosine autokinase [Mailhella sp.]
MQTKSAAPAPAADDGLLEIDLSVLLKAVLVRWKLCAAIVTGIVALALVYCYMATPIYMANCRMLVEPGNLKVTQITEVYDAEVGRDSRSRDAFMATQIQLLTSDNILAKVFEHFRFGEKEGYASSKEPLAALARQIVIAQIPNTSLLNIGFKDKDPRFSAEVTNFLARTYMDHSRQRSRGLPERGLETLQDELVNMEQRRMEAIRRINEYKKQHDILSVDASQKLGIARVSELDRASVSAQAELAQAQATVEAIAQWRKEGRRLDSIPEAIANPTLTQFKVARLQAQATLLKTLQDFGPGHKSVEIQRHVIRDMDQAINNETENSLTSAQAALASARSRVAIIDAERTQAIADLKKLDQIADEYKLLEDNLKGAETSYNMVLQRVNELQISRSADSGAGGTFQIIVPAVPPQKAAFPKKAKTVAIAGAASVMLSIMLCIVLELLDSTVKRREEIESISGVPVFGFIPRAKEGDRVDYASYDDPQGSVAESFRSLRTSLSLSSAGRKARILAITSSVPGEGKSFTSLNLAVTFARAGKKVVLLDADLRRHRLTKVFGLEGSAVGISNLLAGDIPLSCWGDLAAAPLPDLSLSVLPSGPIPPNPSELLSGELLEPLLKELTDRFDIVIIDAPPVLAVSDTRTLAAIPEVKFLTVVRMLMTEKKQLAMTFDAFSTIGAKVIGTVLTNADVRTEGYGSYSGHGHGYKYGYGYRYDYGTDETSSAKRPWYAKLLSRRRG